MPKILRRENQKFIIAIIVIEEEYQHDFVGFGLESSWNRSIYEDTCPTRVDARRSSSILVLQAPKERSTVQTGVAWDQMTRLGNDSDKLNTNLVKKRALTKVTLKSLAKHEAKKLRLRARYTCSNHRACQHYCCFVESSSKAHHTQNGSGK